MDETGTTVEAKPDGEANDEETKVQEFIHELTACGFSVKVAKAAVSVLGPSDIDEGMWTF